MVKGTAASGNSAEDQFLQAFCGHRREPGDLFAFLSFFEQKEQVVLKNECLSKNGYGMSQVYKKYPKKSNTLIFHFLEKGTVRLLRACFLTIFLAIARYGTNIAS